MSEETAKRLDEIIPIVTSPSFLSSEGIGNEIACYIFDYPPEDELQVRNHLSWMLEWFWSHHSSLRILHLNLFDVVIEYLKERGILDKALEMSQKKGDSAVLRSLKGPLAAEKIRDFIAEKHDLQDQDLILLSGVGSVWPMLRAHSLLNTFHTVMGRVPLVMFYPGKFDGTTLRLFDRIAPTDPGPKTHHYYRAFMLVPRTTTP